MDSRTKISSILILAQCQINFVYKNYHFFNGSFYNRGGINLTLQQLFEQHEKKCSKCEKKADCNRSIHITIVGTTKCEEGEYR